MDEANAKDMRCDVLKDFEAVTLLIA